MSKYEPKYLKLQNKISRLIESGEFTTHECYVALMQSLVDVMITHANISFKLAKDKKEEFCKYANFAIHDIGKSALLYDFSEKEITKIELPPSGNIQ